MVHLPDGIYNTYRQYKQSCNVIHHWVYSSVSRIRQEKTPSQESKPRKSKAHTSRKARNNNRQPPSTGDLLPDPPFSFSTLLSLAREVAASDISIPTSQLALLNMTIRQRKATAAFYSPDADAWRRNESHRSAIELYQEVLDILQKAYQERGGKGEDLAVGVLDDDVFGLTAAMCKLSVAIEEEATSQTLGGKGAENEWLRDNPLLRPSGFMDKRKTKVFPLEAFEVYPDDEMPRRPGKSDSDSDAWLALQCFILDVNNIRKHISVLWKSVTPLGTTSRFTAAMITNHAVHMVKQLEYDLTTDFPQFKDLRTTQDMLSDRFAELLFRASEETKYLVQEQVMSNTWATLNGFTDVLNLPGLQYPILRSGHFGYFKPTASRESMPPEERRREDRCILCNYLPDLVIMYKHSNILPKNGKFHGDFGMAKEFRPYFLDDGHPQTWTFLFSCQIMLDIVHIRRRILEVDVDAMRTIGRRMDVTIDTFLNNGVVYDVNMSEAQNLAHLARYNLEKYLLTDFLTPIKLSAGWDKQSPQACQRDSMWLFNPWLTANCMTDALMENFLLGTGVMGAGGFVQSAIHLWNLLKQTGHLPTITNKNGEGNTALIEKSDIPSKAHVLLMEHLEYVFGDRVFSGPPPTERFLARFELMLGVRPEEFAADKRGRKKTAQNSNRHNAYKSSGRGVTALDSEAWVLHLKDFGLEKFWDTRKRSKPASAAELHPLAYVQALAESELQLSTSATECKGPIVSLDLLKVHQLCIRLFGELHKELRSHFMGVFGRAIDELCPTQVQWPMITGYIMRSDEIRHAGLDQAMLAKAGEIVQKIVGTKELEFFVFSDTD